MIIEIMFDQRYGRAHLCVHARTHRGRLFFLIHCIWGRFVDQL